MLSTGTRIGVYEVIALLGKGGMGEVYRAHDTRLNRDVALKVLPEAFSRDTERMARFEREAKVLASLNHNNIAAIYGFEESGPIRALVMELVEGPTLADRILTGAIPVDEALPIARQVADAVEYAHEKNVIHRDLKPANIKVTTEGVVKVLDFGLAKALADDPGDMDMSNSPTLSMAATRQGVILGTAAYMSPEQARGKIADRRADVWAFGVVLYEMLVGKQLYAGETIPETLASVMKEDANLDSLPADTPPAIRTLVRRCLEKPVRRRVQHIGEARIVIEDVLSGNAPGVVAAPADVTTAPPQRRERVAWVAAGALALVAIAFAVGFFLRAPKAPQAVTPVRLTADIGVDRALYIGYGAAAVLSPDGKRLALVAADPGSVGGRRIFLRSLDQIQAVPLPGTDAATDPFFSPDGQWIGFFALGKLKKVSVQGGAAVTLADATDPRGGSWGDDGNIVFATNLGGLSRVSSAGGTPQPLISLDKQTGEASQVWPQVLPGANAVLYASSTSVTNFDSAEIVVYSIASGQRKTIQRGGIYARYLPSGHVVYVQQGTLFAAGFDLRKLELIGQAVPVVEGVFSSIWGGAQYSISNSGNLAYFPARAGAADVAVYWLDREGRFTPLRETPGNYRNPAVSPDGKRLALEINDGMRSDIWVYDWERDTLTRLTFTGETNGFPVWTPDSQRITYASLEKNGNMNLWWIPADGSGNPQRLTENKSTEYPRSWSPDGKTLAFRRSDPATILDIMTLSMGGDEKSGWKPGEPKPFLNSPIIEEEPAFSSDGRWIAYTNIAAGGAEVYVRPFPGPGGKWQISVGGGQFARWSHNGKELFYRSPDNRIMVVNYTASVDSFRADKPQLWSPGQFTGRGPGVSNYDLHPDGKRFAVLKAPATEQTAAVNKVSFILNFFDELRRKVPVAK